MNKYGYTIRITAPDAYCHNCSTEIPYGYIGKSVHILTKCHDITLKLWPCDLRKSIEFDGMVPHKKSEISPENRYQDKEQTSVLSKCLTGDSISDPQSYGDTCWKIIS